MSARLGIKSREIEGDFDPLVISFLRPASRYFALFSAANDQNCNRVITRRLWTSIGCLYLVTFAICSTAFVGGQTPEEQVWQAVQRTPHPDSAAEFQTVPHLTCLNQGKTGICWSFATCSFVESEMARLKLEPVRLSVL